MIGETLEDCVDGINKDKDANGKIEDVINGVRVVDKSRGYPLYKLEIWMRSRDQAVKDKVHQRLLDIVTDEQEKLPTSNKQKGGVYPKFDWKDHSA